MKLYTGFPPLGLHIIKKKRRQDVRLKKHKLVLFKNIYIFGLFSAFLDGYGKERGRQAAEARRSDSNPGQPLSAMQHMVVC